MKRNVKQRDAYMCSRLSDAIDRVIRATTNAEQVRANVWVRAWKDGMTVSVKGGKTTEKCGFSDEQSCFQAVADWTTRLPIVYCLP
jgi:hypothetical protein